MRRAALVAAIVVIAVGACRDRTGPRSPRGAPLAARTLDAFEDLSPWRATGSERVNAALRSATGSDGKTGTALRLDFDLGGTSGYAIARRDLPLDLSDDFELSFDLRGEVPINNFELKLIDATGENVWWYRRANYEFPVSWRRIVVRRSLIAFAWGPTADHTLRRVAAIEIVVSAGRGGGKGAIELDQLALRPRPSVPVPLPAPRAVATSAAQGAAAALAVDGQPGTAWASDTSAGTAQQLTVDLGFERDIGGLLVQWADGGAATDYTVELSNDGAAWQSAAAITGGDGGLDPIALPDGSARYVRLSLSHGAARGYRLAELSVLDFAAAGTPNAFAGALARALPRGNFPRGQLGEQPYWTIVGVDGGHQTALLSEDGALELRAGASGGPAIGGASIEPFVETAAGVTSWANAGEIAQSLEDRYLPIPRVVWRTEAWELEITALASPVDPKLAGSSQLAARYTLRNRTAAPLPTKLVLAVRPLQVNPPTQFLNIAGGVRPIHRLAWAGGALAIDGEPAVRPLTSPDRVSLWPLHAVGYPTAPLAQTPLEVTDPTGFASGALAYEVALAPHGEATIVLTSPLDGDLPASAPVDATDAAAWFETALADARKAWHASLDRVAFRVPPAGAPIIDTLRSSLAYMLISRDGPILRPGTRSYARAWIRDGAMISEALLRLRHPDVAADFLRWYAPYQFESGKVPCCVEPTGAVPVPEHDSHGQLIFLAAELYRYTRDRRLLAAVWPNVQAAARALDELRRSERTAENQTPARRALYGMLPPSISHEGYSARPAYSYWDDFWGLTGMNDAVWIAGELGEAKATAALTAQRDEFQRDLLASIEASAADHRVPFIPGAADLGDFDATSTTIALAPAGLQRALPPQLLHETFERAWRAIEDRGTGSASWDAYTPYELRLVGSFVRLGWRQRAEAALASYFRDRRPAPWNQWAEVVGRELREPRFIGDMPHAWVHSDYARSALDLFAYLRFEDRALVLAAGIPPAWFDGTGFAVENLATPYGALSYEVTSTAREITIRIGPGSVPPGGLVIPWPFASPPGEARVSGRRVAWRGTSPELVVDRRPATITIHRSGVPKLP